MSPPAGLEPRIWPRRPVATSAPPAKPAVSFGCGCHRAASALIALLLVACAQSPKPPPAIAPGPVKSPGAAPAAQAHPNDASGANSVPVASWKIAEAARQRGFAKTNTYDPRTGASLGPLSLKSQRMRAVLAGGIARTEVVEELTNDQPRPLEARLEFAIPDVESLSRLALSRGQKLIEGRVFDSDQIALIPRGPVKDPFEGAGPERDALVMRIVGFAPKETRRLLLAYDGLLEHHGTLDIYRYPLSNSEVSSVSLDQFSIEVTIMGAHDDFGRIATPGYDSDIRRLADRVVIAFEHRAFVPDRDFSVEVERTKRAPIEAEVDVPGWKKSAEHELWTPASTEEVRSQKQGVGHAALRIELPQPAEPESGGAGPASRVLVLDKSYSQSGASFTLQREIVQALLRASANERYVLLACDSACSQWPAGGLTPASADLATKAAAWLREMSPSGSFDLEGALARAVLALEPGSRGQIVYLGAGRVSAGTLEPAALFDSANHLLARRGADLRLFGLGPTLDEALLFGLATGADATYAVLSDVIPAELQAADMLRMLRAPKLTSVKVELPAGLVEQRPARLPALVLGEPVRFAARLTAPVVGTVRISGLVAGRPRVMSYPIALAEDSAQPNPLVTRLWARESLREADRSLTGSRFELGASQLSRSARIASRHTDWLLLEAQAYDDYGLTPAQRALPRVRATKRSVAKVASRPRGVFPERVQEGVVSSAHFVSIGQPGSPPLLPKAGARLVLLDPHGGPISNSQQDTLGKWELSGLYPEMRACFERHLALIDGWFEGRLDFLMRIGEGGAFESLAGEGAPGRDVRAIFGCVRTAVASMPFSRQPPLEDAAELRFALDFVVGWRGGLRADDNYLLSTTISPGDEKWRNAVPRMPAERLAHDVMEAQTPAHALDAALHGVERVPRSSAALDLLATAAGAGNEPQLLSAALEAKLSLWPDQPELRRRLARAWLAAGDERRACAHLRSLAPDLDLMPAEARFQRNSTLALANAICRRHWFDEPATPSAASIQHTSDEEVIALALAELDSNQHCQPFNVIVHCEDARLCPSAAVMTPDSQIVSSFAAIPGKGTSAPLSFWPSTLGKYRVLLLDGDPMAHATVDVNVGDDSKRFEFLRAGSTQTVAVVEIQAGGPNATHSSICGGTAK